MPPGGVIHAWGVWRSVPIRHLRWIRQAMRTDNRHRREGVVGMAPTPTLLVLLLCSLLPAVLEGQAGERQVVLVRTPAGMFVEATPDGRQSTAKYVVPEGQELCLTDIVWIMNGPPNESLTMELNNVNLDGTSDWRIWTVTATMNASRDASGQSSFRTGPKITHNAEVRAGFPPGLSGAGFTLYGRQRPASTNPCS